MHRSLIAAALAAALASTVQAAEPAEPRSGFTAGVGVAVLPKYLGSDQHRAVPVVDLSYVNKNGFFLGTKDGIGMRAQAGSFQFSAALGHGGGRKDRDTRYQSGSGELRGMGEVRSSALANLSVGYDFGFMTFGMEAKLALTHRERGNRLEFAAGLPLLAGAKDNVALFAALNLADRKNMQTFYGVTTEQSARSGFRVFTPKSGVEKVGLGVSWNHQLNPNWSVHTMGGAFSLVGDAADSPLTRRKTAPVLFTTFNYRF
jgi:outer membrane scaffolding protein for murein synthesis (MipA/OmpV family)